MRKILAAAALVLAAVAAGPTSGQTPAGTAAADVKYYRAADVEAAFAKGMPLLEQLNYKIHASRRETPGMVEVHVKDTDIIYVLEGSASFVIGGKMVDSKTIAPDEIRGTGVDGGTTYTLAKGDVIVVPNGMAHWFKAVNGPLLYYTVKVQ